MRTPFFGASLLVLVAVGLNAQGQSYTIKLKLDPDPGQSVVVRSSIKDDRSMKLFDLDGKLLHEKKPAVREYVFTKTTLEKGDKSPSKYKEVYETATEAEGDAKAKPFSYQGRTLVFELKDGKYRVGVVGKPPLDDEDQENMVDGANQSSESSLLIDNLAPSEAVKVGDSWKIDVKKIAPGAKPALISVEKSTVEAKLVKVYTKEKRQFGVIEIKAHLLIEGVEGFATFETPAREDITMIVDGAIDGTSTLCTITMTERFNGKGKMFRGKEPAGTLELDGKMTLHKEYSAEKVDPKGREVPVVEFPSGKLAWKEFSSKEGKFSVNFPGTPKVESKKDAEGIVIVTVSDRSLTENSVIEYLVNYRDLTADYLKLGTKSLLEGIATAMKGDPKSYKEVSLNGFPGLEAVCELDDSRQKLFLKTRLYLVKNRLYKVIVSAEQGKQDKAEVEKFLDSFRLSEKAEEKKEPGK